MPTSIEPVMSSERHCYAASRVTARSAASMGMRSSGFRTSSFSVMILVTASSTYRKGSRGVTFQSLCSEIRRPARSADAHGS